MGFFLFQRYHLSLAPGFQGKFGFMRSEELLSYVCINRHRRLHGKNQNTSVIVSE